MNPVRADLNRPPRFKPTLRLSIILTVPMYLRSTLEVDAVDPALDRLEIGVPPADVIVIQEEIGSSGAGR